MAYNVIEKREEQNVRQDDMLASKRYVIERKPDTNYFYELEEAVVLDVVMDENHPVVQQSTLSKNDWPPNIDGSEPSAEEMDYSWIGCIRFRFLNSETNSEKETLSWAAPLENTGIVEYPLMNEVVIVGKYKGQYFYTRKLNVNSTINANADFSAERNAGFVERNVNIYDDPIEGVYYDENGKDAPESKMNFSGGPNYTGVLGTYFKFNPKIRALKSYEGDTILQSRFGSSIRFGAYDDNRKHDNGVGDYADGGGNPMILIRNGQATITTDQGYNGKGYTLEDINGDGSSIHITSGKTATKFVPPTGKPIISGRRPAKLPKVMDGDQIVFNSGRIIMSSKSNEMLFFSKKRLALVSDDEISLDCVKRLTITSMKTATINAPKIYLGDHAKPYEPALLGRSTIFFLYTLIDWMLLNVNSQIQMNITLLGHFHIEFKPPFVSGPSFPPFLIAMAENLQSLYASQISLIVLQTQLSTLLSTRVFVSGGLD